MFRALCNQLCIRTKKKLRPMIRKAALWAGVPVLPEGFSMFNDEIAQRAGVDRAAMHQKLKGWQEYNQREGKRSHFRGGRWWTYGRPEYWLEKEFAWSSLSTVKRAFKDLEMAGLLLIEQSGGQMWLSALTGEAVNLNGGAVNLQLPLFNLDSSASNWPSSIQESTTPSSAKTKRQSKPRKKVSPRQSVVADFNFPEQQEYIGEKREAQEAGEEGYDILRALPGELVTAWRDKSLPLEAYAAAHGVDLINAVWPQTTGYKNRIAGLRDRIGQAPSPRSANPPSGDDTTEQDWTAEEDDELVTAAPEPEVTGPNAETWALAMSQLELQFDPNTFRTWISGASYLRDEAAGWVIRGTSAQACAMLQGRLYRDVRRVLRDVAGRNIELRFECAEAGHG